MFVTIFMIIVWIMNYTGISDVLCWNCRGISNLSTRNQFWDLINKHKPQTFYLVETKMNVDRYHHFCKRVSKD